jgi:hypothetical protein
VSETTRTAARPPASVSVPIATVNPFATISTGSEAACESGITSPGLSAFTSSAVKSVKPASTTMWSRSTGAGTYGP